MEKIMNMQFLGQNLFLTCADGMRDVAAGEWLPTGEGKESGWSGTRRAKGGERSWTSRGGRWGSGHRRANSGWGGGVGLTDFQWPTALEEVGSGSPTVVAIHPVVKEEWLTNGSSYQIHYPFLFFVFQPNIQWGMVLSPNQTINRNNETTYPILS